MCEQAMDEEASVELMKALVAREERFWGKRLKMPEVPPEWPPRHDVMNYRIGRRIRARRCWGHVFQADLAHALGISQARLSRIEVGLSSVTVVELARIAALLETTSEWLLQEPKDEDDDDW